MTEIISEVSSPKWAPQIVVLLDDETRVLSVNRSLAGTSFDSISESADQRVHNQMHPDCDGKCRFNAMWNKAWASLRSRDSIEWELEDPQLRRLFRMNLSKTPEPANIENDRRQRHTLLTITDITKYRREYESLVEQQQALIRLLMAQRLGSGDADHEPFDETGDTGNRLMAGFAKTEKSLSRQLIIAQEQERKRIASELHDGLAQIVGVLKYRIEDSVANLEREHPDLDLSVLDGLVEEAKYLVEEVRRISSNLSPSMLEDFGIQVALEWLCREFKAQNKGIKVNCCVRIDESETPELVKVAIYRVAQEALNNVAKHSSAGCVDASLESAEGGVKLVVSDDGAGFDPKDKQQGYDGKDGLGLRSMRERVEATGGKFTVDSARGKGTSVHAIWPVEELDPNR